MRTALLSSVAVAVSAACVAPTPGAVRQVPDPVSTRYINPGTLAALPGFTHAVRIGPTLYVSGEVALDSTGRLVGPGDRKSTRLNSSHLVISYAVFCLKKKNSFARPEQVDDAPSLAFVV